MLRKTLCGVKHSHDVIFSYNKMKFLLTFTVNSRDKLLAIKYSSIILILKIIVVVERRDYNFAANIYLWV